MNTDIKNVKSERNTKQKRTVISVFNAMRNHPSAEMVCDEVRLVDPSIGRATVYRVLNSLVEKGLAIKVPIDDGSFRYDITVRQHSHAKCRICGEVSDIVTDGLYPGIIDGWREKLQDRQVDGMRLDYIWCNQAKEVLSSKVMFNGTTAPVVSDHFGVMIEVKEQA